MGGQSPCFCSRILNSVVRTTDLFRPWPHGQDQQTWLVCLKSQEALWVLFQMREMENSVERKRSRAKLNMRSTTKNRSAMQNCWAAGGAVWSGKSMRNADDGLKNEATTKEKRNVIRHKCFLRISNYPVNCWVGKSKHKLTIKHETLVLSN